MLAAHIQKLRDFSQRRYYKAFRAHNKVWPLEKFKKEKLSFGRRAAELLKLMCTQETPIVLPDERISFLRTIIDIPPYYDEADIQEYYKPDKGEVYSVINNVCVDYARLINRGLGYYRDICINKSLSGSNKEKDYFESVIISIDSVLDLVKRYKAEAEKVGNHKVAEILSKVPFGPAGSFHEALQSIRIVSSMFYLSGNYQIGFGRFDQYMYPLYKMDIEEGRITRDEAYELLAEFFISLNKDTDLYFGVQQGDNGQSLMLGGVHTDGSSAINDLTYLVMEVSRDLKLIDPKINLRIDRDTPQDLLELGCELTRAGLGFPQYQNDEVVIPALVSHGYSLEDARDYTVAACWEFIIPGKGLDVVNQGALSYPAAVHEAFMSVDLEEIDSLGLEKEIRKNIQLQVENILGNRNIVLLPAPFVSVFFDGCIETGRDVCEAAKYRNVGLHGAGLANGADALTIIEKLIENKDYKSLGELKDAVSVNFESYEALRCELREVFEKTGNDEKPSNASIEKLTNIFADVCESLSVNGKVVRPGSGSAQFYVWLCNRDKFPWLIEHTIGAGEDGRLEGEPFPSSLAPAHGIKVNGVLSVIKSFASIDYSRIMNGGPITIELSPSAIDGQDGIEKLALLIRYFVQVGDQQLQLNVLNSETLEEAMKYPERHRNLVVRVWGWSGYFCELSPEFQRQIINRHKYAL